MKKDARDESSIVLTKAQCQGGWCWNQTKPFHPEKKRGWGRSRPRCSHSPCNLPPRETAPGKACLQKWRINSHGWSDKNPEADFEAVVSVKTGEESHTDDGEDLPDTDGGVEAGFAQVISKLASTHRNDAAAEVRQGRQHPVLSRTGAAGLQHHAVLKHHHQSCVFCSFVPHLLDAESQYITHVGWQQGQEGVEGPVEGKVSHNNGPEWSGCHYGPPGDVLCGESQLNWAESTVMASTGYSFFCQCIK